MSADKRITILGFRPVHPGPGEPSRIELCVVLKYLKGEPVVCIPIEPKDALRHIEDLAMAVRVTSG